MSSAVQFYLRNQWEDCIYMQVMYDKRKKKPGASGWELLNPKERFKAYEKRSEAATYSIEVKLLSLRGCTGSIC